MKKHLLMMLCCLAALIGTAAEVTVTPTAANGTSGTIEWSSAKNSGSTAPTYNGSRKDLRIYAKGTLTVKSSETMTKIVFSVSDQGKKRLAPITASVGEIATQASGDATVTWTGNANEVTFTVGDKANYGSDGSTKAGQFCFTDFIVTQEGDAGQKYPNISFEEASYTATVGKVFTATLVNPNSLTATYSSSDEAVATVNATTGEVTPLSAGTTTITAKTEETEEFFAGEASYTLVVSEPAVAGDNEVKITLSEQGYSDKQVISSVKFDEIISASFTKGSGSNASTYYTSGTALRVYSGNSMEVKSNNADAKITKIIFTCTTNSYASALGGAEINAPADSKLSQDGSIVTWEGNASSVKLTLKAQTRITSIEVFYSVEDGTTKPAGIAYDVDAVSVLMGEEFTAPVLANPNSLEVTFTSSNEEVATVDAEGKVTIVGPGTTEITATSAATEEFRAGKASYILNVTEAITCAGFFELTAGAEVIFKNPLTVLYQNGANLFVTDGTANLLVYGALNAEFANGDVIAKGAKGTVAEYSGNLQLTPVAASFVAAGKVEAIAPTRMTIAEALEAPIYSFVELYAVDIEAGSKARNYTASTKESEMAVYDNFYNLSNEGFTADENSIYNVIGFMGAYKGTAQLNAYEITEVSSAPTINGMVQNPGEVKDPVKLGDILTIETPDTKATISYLIEEADAPAAIAPRAADATAEWVDTNENPYSFEVTNESLGKRITFAANKNGVRTGLSTITLGNNGTITGIEGVEAEAANGEVEYFNLQGVRVANPTEGLYIRRQGNKVEKVAIR